MKSVVVYFSFSGNTKFVADTIAAATGADVEGIEEVKERSLKGLGYMKAGGEGMRKKLVDIKPASKDPADYDVIYLGCPIWGFNMAPALRSYLTQNKITGKKIALFCCMGGRGDKKAFEDVVELTRDCEVLGKLAIRDVEQKDQKKAKSTIIEWVGGLSLK